MTTTHLDELAPLAWAHLWQVTVVALALGAAVKLGCRRRPRLAYALWMVVVVKSIVPPVWGSPTGLFSWAMVGGAASRPAAAAEPPLPVMVADVSADAPAGGGPTRVPGGSGGGAYRHRRGEEARSPLYLAAFSIWAAGAALFTAFVLGKQVACSIAIRRSGLPADERYIATMAQLARRLGVGRSVRLVLTSRPIGPAAFGLLRPAILLPEPLLCGLPPEQVGLVLAHELVHVRRGDIYAGKLQLVAQIVWWFHPLVWWANREACRERERCCDEEVVSGVGCRPALYARALLSVLERKGKLRSLVAIPGVRALEVTSIRLESIMNYAETDHRRASLISRLAFAAAAVLLVPGAGWVNRGDPPADGGPVVATAGVVAGAPHPRAIDDVGAKARDRPRAETLPGGVTVELIGVSTHPPGPGTWWSPDGTPLPEAPFAGAGGRAYPQAGRRARQFAVRLRDIPMRDVSHSWKFTHDGQVISGSSASGSPSDEDARPIPGMETLAIMLPEGRATCTVHFGVAAGPWTTEATSGPGGGSAQGTERAEVIFGTARDIGGRTAIAVGHGALAGDVRVVAIDHRGETVAPVRTRKSGVSKLHQVDVEFDIAPGQIEEFRFQLRPFEWAQFDEVALETGG